MRTAPLAAAFAALALCPLRAAAETPAALQFAERSNAFTHVFVTSEKRSVDGFTGSLGLSITGGFNPQYSLDGAPFTASPGVITAGQTLVVRHLASSNESTRLFSTVTVGSNSSSFVSISSSADRSPNTFRFASKAYVAPGAVIESTTVTPNGYNTIVGIAVNPASGTQYRINNGSYTSAAGKLSPGQSVTLRHTAETSRLNYTRSVLTVGDVTAIFTSRTQGIIDETLPLDADGDGVTDDIEECPGTPANTSVEINGCTSAQRNFALSVSHSGDGLVSSIPAGIDCGSDCNKNFADGSSVVLTATPGTGYRFDGWTVANNGGNCPGTGTCTIVMDRAQTVAARFSLIPRYRLAVTLAGDGGGSVASSPAGIACGSDCNEDYAEGSIVTLTASATSGSSFTGWGSPCAGTGTCVVTMDAAKTVIASFKADVVATSCNAQDGLAVSPAPQAGPPLMRLAAPDVPILQNRDARFVAAPLMVSGHEKYAAGEYLYQDYVFDDFGAETSGAPFNTAFITSPASGTATPDAANYRSGDIAYPSNTARFGENAADLVELRIVPGSSDVAYRVTLNTLLAKDTTLVAIAWNKDATTTGGSSTLVPTAATTVAQGNHGNIGLTVPGTDEVIYLWNNAAGVGGQHVAFSATGVGTVTPLTVNIDLAANQMTVLVPRAVHNPSGSGWKYVLMSGLHDGNGTWLRPTQNASATVPGGAAMASTAPPAIFDINNHFAVANGQAGKIGEVCHYLDSACDTVQAIALRQVNGTTAPPLTAFARAVDFNALAAAAVSTSVPAEGASNPDKKSLVRLFASRIVGTPAEGHERSPDQGSAAGSGTGLSGVPTSDRIFFYGPLQAYSIYVPSAYRSGTPAPLTWSNHSLAQYHTQYNGTRFVQEAGEKRGSLVVTPNSRSADGFYVGRNEVDHFEVWADVLRNYSVDEARTTMTGYSMGGYATYRLATLYPDLFSRALSVVGPAGAGVWKGTGGVGSGTTASTAEEYYTLTNYWLENTRNLPFFNMAMVTDYLVPIAGPRQQNIGNTAAGDQSFEALGYRYTYQEFQSGEHLTLFANDSYPQAMAFLGNAAVDSNPAHVTYSYVPDADYTLPASADGAAVKLNHDHAYWVSNLVLRNAADGPAPVNKSAKGTVDVRSLGFGLADAIAAPQTTTPGTLTGGNASPALAYTEYKKTWAPPLSVPAENRMVLTLTNLGAVHIDLARAAINPSQALTLNTSSDGASTLNLAGSFPGFANYTVLEDGAPLCTAKVGPNGARVPVKSGSHIYRLQPGL